MDADAGQHKRKIVAFIGGLDLCMGRYDTPEHSLFRTLQTAHKDDFYNNNFEVSHPFCFYFHYFSSFVCVKSPTLNEIGKRVYKKWTFLASYAGFVRQCQNLSKIRCATCCQVIIIRPLVSCSQMSCLGCEGV